MTIDFGIRSRLTAWSLLMTRSPSMLSPSCAPRIAPTYPAEPPPMTATSNASSGIRIDCTQPPTGQLTLQHRQRRGQLQVLGEVIRCVVDRILVLGAG